MFSTETGEKPGKVKGAPLNRRTFLVIYIAYIHLTGYLLAPKRKHLKLTEAQALIKGIRGIKLLAGAFLDGLDLQVLVSLGGGRSSASQ